MFKPGDEVVVNWAAPINKDISIYKDNTRNEYHCVFIFERVNPENKNCAFFINKTTNERNSYYIKRFKLLTKYANTTLLTGGNV